MRVGFYLLPAALVASQSIMAQSFIGVEESQQRLFPGAVLTKSFTTLSDDQYKQIRQTFRSALNSREVMVWRASTGGWYFLDMMIVKDANLTYAVALDATGTVIGVEVLECVAHYDISNRAWLAQFRGKKSAPGEDVKNLSGVSLSSDAIKSGVGKFLAIYDVLPPH
jgi:hypothetical protein